jgi:hypothetical protein
MIPDINVVVSALISINLKHQRFPVKIAREMEIVRGGGAVRIGGAEVPISWEDSCWNIWSHLI